MSDQFFAQPILNSPYEYPARHWELDTSGQPTQEIVSSRRRADFITPIPKPRKKKGEHEQAGLLFDEGKGLSTAQQAYDHTAIINAVRQEVDAWRKLPPSQWRVTLKQPVYWNIGATTSSLVCVRSSARSKRPRPPSG